MTIENLKEKPVRKEKLETRVVVCDDGFGITTTRTIDTNTPLKPGEHPSGYEAGLDVPDGRRR